MLSDSNGKPILLKSPGISSVKAFDFSRLLTQKKISKSSFNTNNNPIKNNIYYYGKGNESDTKIWACSPIRRNSLKKRIILADRKHSFEHLSLRPLIFSSVRVAIIQGGQVMTTFLTDQLEYESANEELLVQGKLTPDETDEKNIQWETKEWHERWKQFPKRFLYAWLRLQGAMLCMRVYEHMASKLFSTKILDKLTKDPFKSSKRKSEKHDFMNRENQRWMIGKKMFRTCLWSNAISFLSDYTIQQCILLSGHCIYYQHQRRMIQKRIKEKEQNDDDMDQDYDSYNEIGAGGIGLSLAMRSSRLLVSRGTSWIVSSASGAVGSAIYPGWGTLFGTQVGDGIAGAVMDVKNY